MNVHQRLALPVLILFLAFATAGPGYARSQRTIADTLQPEPVKDSIGQTSSGTINASYSTIKNQPGTKQNLNQQFKTWSYTRSGVIVTGVGAIGEFVLGFGLVGITHPLFGPFFQVMGILCIVIAGMTTVMFFHRLKRYKARKALEKGTIDG